MKIVSFKPTALCAQCAHQRRSHVDDGPCACGTCPQFTEVPPRVCRARRVNRGDGPCFGPVCVDVVFKSPTNGKVIDRIPACRTHAIAEQDRAIFAGTIARVEIEEVGTVR